ncbi:ubiquitin specific protease 20/33 [Haematobia irritans]|uniref:ubiquitin specific protease 20/33 n=1 Tax=Haematobia irritans TaxID=7368 RepID=UPI003F4F4488
MSKQQPCSHLSPVHHVLHLLDIKLDENNVCSNCQYAGPNLWICLCKKCMFIGCSEQCSDHSTEHFQRSKDKYLHSIALNLSSQRAWCYLCEREVPIGGVERPAQIVDPVVRAMRYSDDENDSDFGSGSDTGNGLVGLQNIANTCYMNSALQALSNVVPMTHYFLNCGDLMDQTLEQGASLQRCKAGLAKSYQRLMRDMWRRRDGKPFLAPRSILYGIRSVHPMFRGFQQHDTQEFLRCFMDQLHEELKESSHTTFENTKRSFPTSQESPEEDDISSDISSSASSQNLETNYVTCDSSNSESSSLCDNFTSPNLAAKNNTQSAAISSTTSPCSSNNANTSSLSSPTSVRSIVSEIFDGKLVSAVQCLTCDRISTREETFQDLSLPIPNRDFLTVLHQTNSMSVQSLNSIDSGSTNTARAQEGWISWIWNIVRSWLWGPSVTLHDCMASFFSADELKGDNMYSCEKCNKLRTGVKYSRILELPEVLCIHLKRFRHDLSYSSKISSHVEFPLENLDMRPYIHKDCKSQVANYNLTAVICHHGTVGGGHYTCLARNAFTDRWYEFDDHHVNEVSTDTVQNCQAYVLFYQKHNPQIDLLRFEANEMSASYPVAQSDLRFYISREWLARFNTFSEPGPISNWKMLCPHGGVMHTKMPMIHQLAVPISQHLWEFLYRKFGGGPAINMLFECAECKREAEALAQRQHYEHSVFQRYNGLDTELDSGAIYAISMPWLKSWQKFARGLTHKDPGPINNANIVPCSKEVIVKNSPVRSVRTGSDYVQLNAPLWRFLYDIYGGGPEVLLRPSLTEEIVIIDQDELDEDDGMLGSGNMSDTESKLGDFRYYHSLPSDHYISSNNSEGVINEINESDDADLENTAINKNKQKPKENIMNKKYSKISTISKKSKHKENKDLFGPQGNYNPKDETHSLNDGDLEEYKEQNNAEDDVVNNNNNNNNSSKSIYTKSKKNSFRSDKRSRKFSSSTTSTNENVNTTNETPPMSGRLQNHGGKRSKNKNSVVLKNFQSLAHEEVAASTSNNQDSNETDV